MKSHNQSANWISAWGTGMFESRAYLNFILQSFFELQVCIIRSVDQDLAKITKMLRKPLIKIWSISVKLSQIINSSHEFFQQTPTCLLHLQRLNVPKWMHSDALHRLLHSKELSSALVKRLKHIAQRSTTSAGSMDPRIEFGKGSKSWAEFMGVECARWRLTWFEGRSLSIMDNYGAFQPTPSKRSIRSKLAAQIFSTNLSSSSHSLGNSTCISLYQVCEISNPPFQLRDALAQIQVLQRVQSTCTGLSICKTLPVLVRVSEDDVIISVTNSNQLVFSFVRTMWIGRLLMPGGPLDAGTVDGRRWTHCFQEHGALFQGQWKHTSLEPVSLFVSHNLVWSVTMLWDPWGK